MTSLNSLVNDCLIGNHNAYVELDREMRPQLVASLQIRGASLSWAEEIAADVLGDCSLGSEKSLLKRFDGKREFKSWLLRVAINRLIDRLRRKRLFPELDPESNIPVQVDSAVPPDNALWTITRRALKENCAIIEPEIRVLLWLTFALEVKQCRLAKVWGWSEAKLSRKLSSGLDKIRERTLKRVEGLESGLKLTWEDIIGACAEMKDGFFFNNFAKGNPSTRLIL